MDNSISVVIPPQFVVNVVQVTGGSAGFSVLAGTTNFVVRVSASTGGGIAMSDEEVKTAYENNANTNEFSDAEQTKLAGIMAGATDDLTGAEIKVLYELEADTNAFDDAEQSKLAGIASGADVSPTPLTDTQIKTQYELNANTNVHTDAQVTKLAGIETGAKADQTDGEIETAYNAQVAKISGSEITAGTEATVRRVSPADLKAIVLAHETGGSGEPNPDQVSAQEMTDGTETALRSFSPDNIENMAQLHGGGGFPANPVITGKLSWLTDVVLERDGPGILAQRDGANNQMFSVYNWYTNSTNWERANFGWTGGIFYLGTSSDGTGSGRAIGFVTDDVLRWAISATGHFAPAFDNVHDIGLNGSNRPRNVFLGGTLNLQNVDVNKSSMVISGYSLTGADASNMMDLSGTWNTTGAPTLLYADVLDTASDAGAMLVNLKVGGTSMFSVTKAGLVTAISGLGGMSDAQVKTAYENNADTNEFSDAEKTALGTMESGATTDQTDSEIETAYNAQVAKISAGEITAGTEVTVRRFSPDDVEAMIAVHGGSGGGGGPLSGDPDWANVSLLVGANGADQSTSFLDEGPTAHALTANGNAKQVTATKKFGSASIDLDGSGDYVRAAPSSEFDFGDGDFTIEFWTMRASEPPSYMSWMSKWDINSNQRQWNFMYDFALNTVTLYVSTNGADFPTATFDLDTDGVSVAQFFDGNFHHVAAVRESGTLKIYVDGQVGAATWAGGASSLYANTGIDMLIGARRSGAGVDQEMDAHIDEVRITKGVARYTAEFTPPTEEFLRAGEFLTNAEIKIAYELNADTNVHTDAQVTKLAGIDTGAKDDQTGSEIKTAYQAEANAYTDTKNTKLAGIETSAKDDQTDGEIATAYANQVGQVSAGEITAGTEPTLRTYAPDDIKAFIDEHGGDGGGALIGYQVITSSDTYTPTAGAEKMRVTCIAGGGGGAGVKSTNGSYETAGGGGGSGGYAVSLINDAQSHFGATITVGAAGVGGTDGTTNATDGGDTSFAALVVTTGGIGGISVGHNGSGGGSDGGTATAGDIQQNGAFGNGGLTTSGDNARGGHGGYAFMGAGGNGGFAYPGSSVSSNEGKLAPAYGGGGGGAASSNSTATAVGGDGGAGLVIIEEYGSGSSAAEVNLFTDNHTLALTDAEDIVEMDKATANVLLIPTNATVPFPIGVVISVSMIGVGVTSITADTGVTLNRVSTGSGEMTGQDAGVSLYQRATDVWIAQGAIGTVA